MLLAASLVAAPPGASAFVKRPRIYFYPPPALFADGSVLSSPLTVSETQATIMVPTPGPMDGIAVLLPWSLLCPMADRCDFGMLDRVLDYWRRRGKTVVLGIATVGYPFRVGPSGNGPSDRAGHRSVTPEWVLNRVSTYTASVAELDDGRIVSQRYPRYDDPAFRRCLRDLVRRLGRYDGDPAIAELRIGLGMLTEDNPNPAGGYRYGADAFTDADWVAFCQAQVASFSRTFHRTRLEVDLGVLGHIAVAGAPDARGAASRLLHGLVRAGVFLAFDGWSGRTADLERAAPDSGIGVVLKLLEQSRRCGNRTGLEAIGPVTDPAMADRDALLRTADRVRPNRVLFFADLGALMERQEGRDRSPNTALDFWNAQPGRVGAMSTPARIRAWLRGGEDAR